MNDPAPASLTELDPALAATLSARDRAAAGTGTPVRTVTIERGGWDAIGEFGECRSWLGLLVVEGFLSRRTAFAGETVGEIVGPGDVLRPWDHDGEYPVRGIATSWQALAPTRIALLDDGFAARLAPWATLTAATLARIGRRARWSALRLLISQIPGVEIRVLYLLWHLAERWGQTVDGRLRVPIPLTHEQIGEVIGAQRPSVSHAVGRLRAEGVRRLPAEGWEIPGDTPQALERMLGTPLHVPS